MEYKYFRWHIIARILLLLALGYSSIYVLTSTHFWLVSFWLILAWLLVLVSLIRYIERSKRELAQFLLSIKQGDFTNTYHFKKKSDLNYAFHEINEVLKELSQEKASNLLYLQTIVEHVRVAVVCYDKDLKIKLYNRAAQQLFGKKQITSVKGIESIAPTIATTIVQMNHGEKALIKAQLNGQLYHLSVLATEFRLKEENFKLVSFQDIKSELDAQEIESWQKLIRVLTHEIKNSVIPISTLSEVLLQMLKTENGSKDISRLDDELIKDVIGGIETIESRSKGLAHFVSTYDRLTKIPKPKIAQTNIKTLINNTLKLFESEFKTRQITVETPNLTGVIQADSDLVEQVIINLIKNAIEALNASRSPVITISTEPLAGELLLKIADNGPGIPDEVLEHIFVPFYSTKEGGSGIGLSLSRQIMRLHKGQLTLDTSPHTGTVFTLHFPTRASDPIK
ncbi:ATP-binding protein [Roseivirga sp. UBA1976]|uniref:sensor histidine kinase n=1 Tax=Roseivirga sp. UBA1976 TaxID=1947386 RepID=UPI00257FBD40|nr:ATP-binding protein [Roseivirga sp. UBA1976]|tara:strand:- start:3196 stop:4554 length:1359 start_codon:yes stop_codon:yes gene_type:complete